MYFSSTKFDINDFIDSHRTMDALTETEPNEMALAFYKATNKNTAD